jgi:type IV pilus assembly protein PilE
MHLPVSLPRTTRQRGFSLIELLVVVGVIGIIAAIAYPSYLSQVRKGRRSDAVDAVAKVMQAQERYRGTNASYGTLTQIGQSTSSAGGYYTQALSSISGTGYTLTLTGNNSQASDTGCTSLTITVTAGSADYSAQPKCWSR